MKRGLLIFTLLLSTRIFGDALSLPAVTDASNSKDYYYQCLSNNESSMSAEDRCEQAANQYFPEEHQAVETESENLFAENVAETESELPQ